MTEEEAKRIDDLVKGLKPVMEEILQAVFKSTKGPFEAALALMVVLAGVSKQADISRDELLTLMSDLYRVSDLHLVKIKGEGVPAA